MQRLRDIDVAADRVAWGLIGVALLAVLVVVARPFVGTLASAVFLYYATRPVYRRVHRRVERPTLAASVTLFVVALPALLVVGYATLVAAQSLSHLFQSADLQQYQALLSPYVDVSTLVHDPREILSHLQESGLSSPESSVVTLVTSLGVYLGVLFEVLLRLFLVFAFTFYLLRDDERLSAWFLGVFGADQRRLGDDRSALAEYADVVDDDLETVYFGNLIHVVIISVLAMVTYHALNFLVPAGAGVPYPTLLGLLTGVGSLVPAVGMKVVYVPVTALLLVSAALASTPLWFAAAFFGVTFVVVDTIPDFVVRAYVSGRNLHTGLVMFAYILGSVVFGWYGIFLGPLLLVLILHFGRLVLPRVVSGVGV